MTGLKIWSLLFLGVWLYVAIGCVREFLAGIVTIKTNWGAVLIKYTKKSEPKAFWIATMTKLLPLALTGYIGFGIVTRP